MEFAYLTNDNRVAFSKGSRVDPKNKVHSIYASYRKHNITNIDAFDLNSMSVVNVELAEQRVYFMPNRTEAKPLQLVSEGIESDLFFKGAYKIGDQVTLHLDKDTGSLIMQSFMLRLEIISLGRFQCMIHKAVKEIAARI